MANLGELALFAVLVIGASVIAIRVGMLLAPRLDRLTNPDDEDDRADHP